MPEILVVDDEESICWGLEKLGRSLGCRVRTAPSAEEGLRLAAQSPPELLVLDVRLPGMDGLSALAEFRRVCGPAPAIVMTAFGALETAVEAVRRGAFEYVLKPFDLQEMRLAFERGLRLRDATPVRPTETPSAGMVGESAAMQALFKRIALAAASDANVLVTGETGVGKDLAARAIHENSPRSAAPFVAVNVAALSPTIVESELFGHVEGAFTGAAKNRPGLLVRANGGTLFLDEVAEIDASLQTKLLRAVEQGEVLPVGGDRPVTTRFRVISASHQDLPERVSAGAFRRDLFYRLCAFEVSVPPLRDRREDIPVLANHFATKASSQPISFAADTMAELLSRDWPGNIRELRNTVEHAAVLARTGAIGPEHLPRSEATRAGSDSDACREFAAAVAARTKQLLHDEAAAGAIYETILREFEASVFREALHHHSGEYAPAARMLGIHRTTLRRKTGTDTD